MLFFFEVLGLTALIPALLAAICFAAGLLLAQDEPRVGDAALEIAGAFSVALALVVPMTFLPWTTFVPADFFWPWIFYATWAIALMIAAARLIKLPRPMLWILGLVVLAIFAWLIVPHWEGTAQWRIVGAIGLTLIALLSWQAVSLGGQSERGPIFPVLLVLNALLAAVVLECADSAKMAQLTLVPTSMLIVIACFAWLHPRRPLLPGAAGALCIFIPGLLVVVCFETFSAVPGVSFWLVMLGPILGGWATASDLLRNSTLSRIMFLSVATLALPIIGTLLAIQATLPAE